MAEFPDLEIEAQVQHMEHLAREALPAWGLEGARLSLIKYRENAVFEVTGADGTHCALRIHRAGYHTDEELWSELQWMAALEQSGIHVPRVVPTRTGESFVVRSTDGVPTPHQIDLFEWVNGAQMGSVEQGLMDSDALARNYQRLGALAAQVHNQATAWKPPPGFTRHAWDLEGLVGDNPFWGRFWELEALTEAQRALIVSARDRVRDDLKTYSEAPENADRYSMIHADFVAENLMVDGDGIRLIDFDDAGYGWHLFELATAVHFELDERHYSAIWEALVAGYRQHRSLPDSQLEHMPLFLMARSFSYLGWVHTRSETETAKELAPVLVDKCCALAQRYLAR